ncbi:hypothetical protein QBC35DRAFT_502913 [Podospora australis]|uniref:Glucose-methanol-choline oxidoreductase N-terminal domain-containing protein n=1 Tax=Podospora australis TaxID=1536484 RepID=A0AAN7AH51_9PEZI|nr:hypothetical protein QBC35DRAFT_502913 [Podospora australis]
MVAVYPFQSDFSYLATLTGDSSWSPENMRKYFARMERKQYLLGLPKGHGRDGWFTTELAPLTIPLRDPQLLAVLTGSASALGSVLRKVINLGTLLAGDLNADNILRDREPGYYQIPISTDKATRLGTREFIVSVRDARNKDGSKKYPLDVRLNCHVTKILFEDTFNGPPRATGVEFLDGAYLYRASPLSAGRQGTKGTVLASREVIVSGGAYNSPQILKLSGIGPKDELKRHGIHVVADLPGVGTNLQDHYEISVNAKARNEWRVLKDCTFLFNTTSDPCLDKWQRPVLGDRGTYATAGFAATMLYKSTTTPDRNWDMFNFGGPVNFQGYYPGYSYDATAEKDMWSWAILKAHPRNTAGSITLRSADPLDVPEIAYNYFDTGNGDYKADLQAIYESIQLARDALYRQPVKFNEVRPGAEFNTQEKVEQYVKDSAWGHHASSTCPIGADGDPMAVLDSKFRVRKVKGLRVVDASVYPRIPGTFTAVSTMMAAEKAADDILADAKRERRWRIWN